MTPAGPDPAEGSTAGQGQDPATALTAFQIEVTRLFFTLPTGARFLLAGGAALLAQQLTDRPTQDLDLFTPDSASVTAARDELDQAARERGWSVTRIHDSPEFCRLVVHGPEDLLVDLALDAASLQAGTASFLGPTFAPEELAGRKLLALFDRAEARDFADVYVLAQRYGKHVLLERASALDQGLDRNVFARFMSTLTRYDDADIPVSPQHVAPLRAFFAIWQDELRP